MRLRTAPETFMLCTVMVGRYRIKCFGSLTGPTAVGLLTAVSMKPVDKDGLQ